MPNVDRPARAVALWLQRWRLLAGLASTVLLMHLLLLAGLRSGQAAQARPAAAAVSVRQIVQLPTPRPLPAPPSAVDQAAVPRPPRPPAPAPAPAQPQPQPQSQPPPADTVAPAQTPAIESDPAPPVEPAEPTQLAAAGPASTSRTAADEGAADEKPPTYATRLPPAALLQYELRRGLITGQGQLDWRPGPGSYEMQLEGGAFGLQVLSWASRGGIDAAGLAPQRYVDQRRGRAARAANFRRDLGVISFSGGGADHALWPGAQDRLSWMVQLAAIVEANPKLRQPGRQVSMLVAGARGDVDVWTFGITGHEAVNVVGGRIENTLAVRREPRKPFDTQVEAWFDPARHHLPVRLKLSTANGSDAMEFILKP
ncbi:MAG: DUF3108 domain-containing protein [Rubrivivax sp.]|nr:DUF3108 domain-containing protein [Rubrivivax sp.]